MKYAIIKDGKVINLALSETALEDNWVEATDTVKIGDEWDGQTFISVEPSLGEKLAVKAIRVRAERDYKLTNSDWTQMPDYNGTDKAAWAAYRQALRDITTQEGFPWDVTWPVQPE